jgi:hypothetical protein
MARRVAFGNFPDGSLGLRVSKPGFDAMMSPADDSKLMFNSDWASCLPIHMVATGVGIGNGTTIIPYADLGYYPFSAYSWYQGSLWAGWVPMLSSGGGSSSTSGVYGSAMQTFNSYAASGAAGFLSVKAQSNRVEIDMLGSVVSQVSIIVFKLQAF